jgi:hypothetical protein
VQPHIAILHVDSVPAETFAGFLQTVSADGLSIHVESRESGGAFAAIEWLIPTAIFAYISKSYFDGFLKEMGKDHYALLKKGLNSLYSKVLGPQAPEVTLISTAGKVKAGQPYSLFFSVVAEGEGEQQIKLLLARSSSKEEYEASVSAFLSLVESVHTNMLDTTKLDALKTVRVVGRTLLVAYNPATGEVEPIDPLPKRDTK